MTDETACVVYERKADSHRSSVVQTGLFQEEHSKPRAFSISDILTEDLDPSLSPVLSNTNAVSAKRRVVLKGALGCCDKREKCG